jgi:hypothetical protein
MSNCGHGRDYNHIYIKGIDEKSVKQAVKDCN